MLISNGSTGRCVAVTERGCLGVLREMLSLFWVWMLHSWCGHPCPCQPWAELSLCASLWIWGLFQSHCGWGVLRTCRGSEEGKFYCSASLLGWNSASAAVLACSQRWANLAQAAGSIVMSLNKRKKKGRKKEGKAKLFNRTHKETCCAFPSQVWNWITMVKQPWMFFFFLIFF